MIVASVHQKDAEDLVSNGRTDHDLGITHTYQTPLTVL